MIQKILRIVSLFLLIALLLSPVYSKNIRHYIKPINLDDVKAAAFENITGKFIEGNNDSYHCRSKGTLFLQPTQEQIKIIHLTSAQCHDCVEEAQIWRDFPLELYNNISTVDERKSVTIEIITLIEGQSISDKASKDFINSLMTKSDSTTSSNIYQEIADAGISTCLAAIDKEAIDKMNIDVLPSSIVFLNDKIIYALAGKISHAEMLRMASIVAKSIKRT